MTTKPSNACQMPEEIWALKANDDDHFKDTDFDKRWDESCNGTNPWLSGGVKYIRADLVEKMKVVEDFTEDQKHLALFYSVETKDALISIMLEHIMKLQAKIPKPFEVAFVKPRKG